jgi:hypothetical protein
VLLLLIVGRDCRIFRKDVAYIVQVAPKEHAMVRTRLSMRRSLMVPTRILNDKKGRPTGRPKKEYRLS